MRAQSAQVISFDLLYVGTQITQLIATAAADNRSDFNVYHSCYHFAVLLQLDIVESRYIDAIVRDRDRNRSIENDEKSIALYNNAQHISIEPAKRANSR